MATKGPHIWHRKRVSDAASVILRDPSADRGCLFRWLLAERTCQIHRLAVIDTDGYFPSRPPSVWFVSEGGRPTSESLTRPVLKEDYSKSYPQLVRAVVRRPVDTSTDLCIRKCDVSVCVWTNGVKYYGYHCMAPLFSYNEMYVHPFGTVHSILQEQSYHVFHLIFLPICLNSSSFDSSLRTEKPEQIKKKIIVYI